MNNSTIKTLAIIPAYMEEDNIAKVIEGVKRHVPEVVVIDDCSPDHTGEIARAAGAHVIRHPINLGYGAAVLTGFLFAQRHSYTCVIYMDADGQHDPAYIPELLRGLEHADISLGSRFMGRSGYKMPFLRRIGNQFFSKIAQKLSGAIISDSTSGFRAVSTKGIKFYNSQYCPDEFFDADMLLLASRFGCTIINIPVTMHANVSGKSMHSGILKPCYYIARMSIGIICAILQARKIEK